MALEHGLEALESLLDTRHVVVALALAHDAVEVEAGGLSGSHRATLPLTTGVVHGVHGALTGRAARFTHHKALKVIVAVLALILAVIHLTIAVLVRAMLLHPDCALLIGVWALRVMGLHANHGITRSLRVIM